jgi:hypothetical protein
LPPGKEKQAQMMLPNNHKNQIEIKDPSQTQDRKKKNHNA